MMRGFGILFIIAMSFTGFTQNPAYFVLGEKEFANTNIYTLLYDDHTDILYVGTNSGLFAYRQSRFVKLERPEEQIGSSVFALKQNSKGEVFCNNLSGQIFSVKNNKYELCYQASKDEMKVHFEYFFDEKNNLIIIISDLSIKSIDSEGTVETIYTNSTGSFMLNATQLIDGDIYIPCFEKAQSLSYKNGQLEKVKSFDKEAKFNRLSYLSLAQKGFYVSDNGSLHIMDDTVYQGFSKKRKEVFFPLNRNEIVGLDSKKGGRILTLRTDTVVEKQTFFNHLFLSSFCSNANQTMFFGTFGEGIVVVPNKKVVKHTHQHLFLGIATSPKNDVYFTTRAGEIFQENNGLNLLGKREANVDNIYHIYGDFKFNSITHNHNHLLYDTYDENTITTIYKDVCQINSDMLLYLDQIGMSLLVRTNEIIPENLDFITKSSFIDNRYMILSGLRGSSVTWSPKDSLIYYSTNFGVFSKEWSSSKTTPVLWKGNSFLGNDLEYYKGQFLSGTEEHGLLFFENKELVKQLSKKEGLESNTIKKIVIKDDLLYILSREGMQVYDLEKEKFLGLGVAEGMIDNGITNFTVSVDKLWLLEKHSYYAVDLAEIVTKNNVAELYVDSVVVNGGKIDLVNQQQFSYKENAFDFYFDYRDIESKSETQISYKLEGFNIDWIAVTASENKIEFQSLPAGTYTLEIKATYRNQDSSSFSYRFEILSPIWQRWWFYLLIGLAVALFITIIALYRIRVIKNRNQQKLKNKEIERNSIDAQLKALRAQMNPHFIFNSINSIQSLVLKNETIKSYDYLVVFSKLVRNTLDFSEREFITLKEEVEFLETYLSLEELRFSVDFSYRLVCDSKETILIPSLIIQPFLENALKHGLLHREGEKTLTVNFNIKGQQLICQIIDNGVGREASEVINQEQGRTHDSFSTQAIKQRMQMLSSQYNTEVTYQTIDLKNENGQASGTKVIICLPFNVENDVR
jgi:two-component sensor histidine kinase